MHPAINHHCFPCDSRPSFQAPLRSLAVSLNHLRWAPKAAIGFRWFTFRAIPIMLCRNCLEIPRFSGYFNMLEPPKLGECSALNMKTMWPTNPHPSTSTPAAFPSTSCNGHKDLHILTLWCFICGSLKPQSWLNRIGRFIPLLDLIHPKCYRMFNPQEVEKNTRKWKEKAS